MICTCLTLMGRRLEVHLRAWQTTCFSGRRMKNTLPATMIFLGAMLWGTTYAATLSECLNAPQLNWTTGGQSPWFAQAAVNHDGIDAARSGAITDDGETWVETQL